MTRARIVLTLALVALAAMLVGLAASLLVTRLASRPDPGREAEPGRTRPAAAYVVNV